MIEENNSSQIPISQPIQEFPKKRSILVPYLLSLVVVALVSGGGVYLWQKSITKTPEASVNQTGILNAIPTEANIENNTSTISNIESSNNSLKSQIENWSTYKIDNKNRGELGDACSDPEPSDLQQLRQKVRQDSMKNLRIGGENYPIVFWTTQNYLKWSNEEFLSKNIGCNVGGPFPLHAYPDRLLWWTGSCGGVLPDTEEGRKELSLCEKTQNEIRKIYGVK